MNDTKKIIYMTRKEYDEKHPVEKISEEDTKVLNDVLRSTYIPDGIDEETGQDRWIVVEEPKLKPDSQTILERIANSLERIADSLEKQETTKDKYSAECLERGEHELCNYRMVDDDCYVVKAFIEQEGRYAYIYYNREDFEEKFEVLD